MCWYNWWPAINDRDALPWLHGVLRVADLLLVVVDLGQDPLAQMQAILAEMEALRIELCSPQEPFTDEYSAPRPALLVGNKADLDPLGQNFGRLAREYSGQFPVKAVSALLGAGLEELRESIFRALRVVRVYLKPPGQDADQSDPLVLRRGSSVDEVAESVHKDIRRSLKYAQVWGSGKFAGQRVHRSYVVEDGDIVELHA